MLFFFTVPIGDTLTATDKDNLVYYKFAVLRDVKGRSKLSEGLRICFLMLHLRAEALRSVPNVEF
jgi:hypothetical protein